MSMALVSEGVSLATLPNLVWRVLNEGCSSWAHPMRTAAFATTDVDDAPAVRTVVLRAANAAPRTLVCYTDVRSAKVQHVQRRPAAALLFWDPTARVQIRAVGPVTVHCGDDVSAAAWAATPVVNRGNYRTALPPGAVTDGAADAVAPVLAVSHAADAAFAADSQLRAEAGFENFAVLRTKVERFEWLQLSEPFHRRASFVWDEKRGEYVGNWIVQ